MFTKQHYKAIAAIVADNTHRRIMNGNPHTPTIQKEGLVRALSDYFAADNPLYNHEKFVEACNIT